MHLPWWFVLLSILSLTAPVTSLALVGTGIGWFISRRKGRFGRARGFVWCTLARAILAGRQRVRRLDDFRDDGRTRGMGTT
jgi:hypothetical protein